MIILKSWSDKNSYKFLERLAYSFCWFVDCDSFDSFSLFIILCRWNLLCLPSWDVEFLRLKFWFRDISRFSVNSLDVDLEKGKKFWNLQAAMMYTTESNVVCYNCFDVFCNLCLLLFSSQSSRQCTHVMIVVINVESYAGSRSLAMTVFVVSEEPLDSKWFGIFSFFVVVFTFPFPTQLPPSPPLDIIRVMVIVWRLRGNIIRTAPCWVVWHNVYSQQHTHVSSSYRSSRLGFSHWDLTPCIEAVA